MDARRRLYSLLTSSAADSTSLATTPSASHGYRAKFETSGELFGCTLPDLRDAIAASLELDPEPLRAAAVRGLLEELQRPARVNLVNALDLARSRGLVIEERRETARRAMRRTT